jgi:hypothetical protein
MGISWRRDNSFIRDGVAFGRRGHAMKTRDKKGGDVSSENRDRGRAAGQGLHQPFRSEQGWAPPRGTKDSAAALILRNDKNQSVNLHRVRGANSSLTIDGADVPVPGLSRVVGALPVSTGRDGQLEVTYVDKSGATYAEMFHRENGAYVTTWPANDDGSRQRRYTHHREIATMVPAFDGGYVGVDDAGTLLFKGTSAQSRDAARAFERELANRGQVESVAATEDGIIVLQKDPSGAKTLASIRVWPTRGDNWSTSFHTEVQSVPIDPEVTEVAYKNTGGDPLGGSNVHLVRGRDTVARVSVSDIGSQASRHKDTPRPASSSRSAQQGVPTFPPLNEKRKL